MTGFLTAALHYARLGMPVLPCKPRDKAPLTEHGFYDATTNDSIIRGWSFKWFDLNIGVRTGVERDGKKLVVVDVDPRNGGDDTLTKFEQEHGALPDTATVLTGGGGTHHYYWCPADIKLQATMGPGVDLKADNGYVVAPPSIHPSGKAYEWEASADLFEGATIADLPTAIIARYSKKALVSFPDHLRQDDISDEEMADIWRDLQAIPASVERKVWIEILMALHSRSASEQMYQLAEAWSKTCPEKFDPLELRKAWNSFKQGGGITVKSIKWIADQQRAEGLDTSALFSTGANDKPNLTPTAHLCVMPTLDESDADHHTNQPKPEHAMLYGLVGDVGRAAAASTEANEYAVAAAYLTFLSAMVGRDVYFALGNTWHHPRIFTLHVGRSGRGRKGDALSLVTRISDVLKKNLLSSTLGQIHRGGLSTREGLAVLIHDGYTIGKEDVAPIKDKRLWVVESEFANVLHQSKRDGNTLSSALRDAWDGVSIRPAVKTSRVWASDPHVAMSGAITPSELRGLMQSRELTNGFANRFMIFWAERTRLIEFPAATKQEVVEALAQRTEAVIRFALGGYPDTKDSRCMSLNPEAAARYGELYRNELNQHADGGRLDALLERRAPVLLRIAMLFALTDQTLVIDKHHIDAALAWVRYWHDSIRFIFGDSGHEEEADECATNCKQIIDFLKARPEADRTELHRECFQNRLHKAKLDKALDYLLHATPPKIEVKKLQRKDGQPGRARKVYRLL